MISFLEASERGREYLRLILSSALEVAEDWFESEEVRAALVRSVSEVLIPPQQQGTGNFVFKFAPAAGGVVIPEGGSGALVEALVRYIEDAGGRILTGARVDKIKVEAGEARGILLEGGEEIQATKAIVSSVHVRQLFLDMLPETVCPQALRAGLERLRPSVFVTMKQDLALSKPPVSRPGETSTGRSSSASLRRLRRCFGCTTTSAPASRKRKIWASAPPRSPTRAGPQRASTSSSSGSMSPTSSREAPPGGTP